MEILQFGSGEASYVDEKFGTWTPTVGGTLTNGSTPSYSTSSGQIGRWVLQGKQLLVNFRVVGTLGTTAPTGSPAIRGLPNTASNQANLIWSKIAFRSYMGGTEGISGIPIWFIKPNENFIRLGIQDNGLNGNPEAEANLWSYRGGTSFEFKGDLVYEIA
jgi:hypothetical protein